MREYKKILTKTGTKKESFCKVERVAGSMHVLIKGYQ
jgi:hypothetical protein